MSRVSNYKNVLYIREYLNDIRVDQTDLMKRILTVAIPFFSLHQSLRFPVSIAMSTLRVWNSDDQDIIGKGVAIASLAGTVFQNQCGMMVTTVHDIFIEINKVRKENNKEEAVKSLIKIVNNLIYLALISRGGLELSIISFAMQAAINLIQCRDEFKKDRWLESVANLVLAGVRLGQSLTQYHQLKKNWEIEAAIKRIYVGKLHEKWRFPSDHLPVGIEVNGIRIISWNVLNNAFLSWVTDKDSQGLNRSLISELNVVVRENGLTKRDILVADMVRSMMEQGDIVALQECSVPFLEYLKEKIPSHWEIVKSFDTDQKDQEVILYDKGQLTYHCELSVTTQSAYPSAPKRPIQNACFSHIKPWNNVRVINSHIPGDFDKPGRIEFANYVHSQHREGTTTIALGDNNFERGEMIEAYQKAGFSDFRLHSPYKTNIDPETKESKSIDHIFIKGVDHSRDLKPEEVLPRRNLQAMIDLLHTDSISE